MSATDYSQWVGEIHAKVKIFRLVFLQIGASNEPARRALLGSNSKLLTIQSYLEGGAGIDCGTLILDQFESLTGRNESAHMGQLREKLFLDLKANIGVILLSRAPRVAFPAVVGSSLLDDASFARAPAQRFNGVDEWPTCSEDGLGPEEVLHRSLVELGPEVCASLDRVVYEAQLTDQEALNLLSARELEALDGAGLTSPESGARLWNIPWHLSPLKMALDTTIASTTDAQHRLANISDAMWKIERLIRREVRRMAVDSWPRNWRTQCLNEDLKRKVLERATESAYIAATTIKQVRDPLEWLSLGELLQLTENPKIGRLGLEPPQWRQFRDQVMPIWNRLAHMRTLHPEDEANAVKWRRVLEARLPN